MARVTVEDCLKHVENRFALVLLAAERAHQLEMGTSDPMVPENNDKPTVIALREIASGRDVEGILRAQEVSNEVIGITAAVSEEIETMFAASMETQEVAQKPSDEDAEE